PSPPRGALRPLLDQGANRAGAARRRDRTLRRVTRRSHAPARVPPERTRRAAARDRVARAPARAVVEPRFGRGLHLLGPGTRHPHRRRLSGPRRQRPLLPADGRLGALSVERRAALRPGGGAAGRAAPRLARVAGDARSLLRPRREALRLVP